MSTPVSFTVRPPASGGGSRRAGNWNAPSQRMFHDDDDDDDEGAFGGLGSSSRGGRARGRPKDEVREERIEGFAANGRTTGSRARTPPLVIAPLPNRDWREVAAGAAGTKRRPPGYVPPKREEGEEVVTHERTNDEPQRRGLRRPGAGERDGAEEDVKPDAAALAGTSEQKPAIPADADDSDTKPDIKTLSLEEQALAAVLAGETEAASTTAQADLVIGGPLSEEAALARDLDLLPVESTLEDYDAVPVEAFGAAMLRGMGYDPSKDTPLHVPKPRPALLGIGATALSTELPPSRAKDPKKRKEAHATRGGRGYNAAKLLVRRGGAGEDTDPDSRATSRATSRSRDDRDDRDGSSVPSEKRRRADDEYDSGRDSRRRYDSDRDDRERRRDRDRDGRRYETDEERARRKARERERRDDRDRDRSRRDDDRDRRRDDDRDRSRRDDDRDRRRDDDRDRSRRDDRRDRDRDRR